MLVHHADAEPGGALGVDDPVRHGVDPDRTSIGQHQADDHPHQRGLAGTVLAEDPVDLARAQCEIDVLARDDVAKPIGHPVKLEEDRTRLSAHHRSVSSLRHVISPVAPRRRRRVR